MQNINHIYAINLDKDTDRWENVKTQLTKVDHSPQHQLLMSKLQRIPAIYGKDLTTEQLDANTTTFCNNFCSPSMIGCFLSHRKAWQTMIENGDHYAIIFEDDIILTDDFTTQLDKTLDELNQTEPEWGMLYLGCYIGCNKDRDYRWFNKLELMLLGKYWNNKTKKKYKYSYQPDLPAGLHAYIITRKTAQFLVNFFSKATYHIDVKIANQQNQINSFAMSKKIAYQDQDDYQSSQFMNYPSILNKKLSELSYADEHNFNLTLSQPIIYLKPLKQNIDAYLILWGIVLFLFVYLKPPLNYFHILIAICLIYNLVEYLNSPANLNRIILFLVLIIPFYLYAKNT